MPAVEQSQEMGQRAGTPAGEAGVEMGTSASTMAAATAKGAVGPWLALTLSWKRRRSRSHELRGSQDRSTPLQHRHMAQDWCLAYGVCPWQDAHDLYIKVCKRKGLKPTAHTPPGTVGSPAKKLRKSGAGGGKGRQAKEDMDGDTGFDPANAYEGVGTMGL
ncbi:unnamed protein product [Discosporangium mesarthrocarpum]